jgi:hypothetical protein
LLPQAKGQLVRFTAISAVSYQLSVASQEIADN